MLETHSLTSDSYTVEALTDGESQSAFRRRHWADPSGPLQFRFFWYLLLWCLTGLSLFLHLLLRCSAQPFSRSLSGTTLPMMIPTSAARAYARSVRADSTTATCGFLQLDKSVRFFGASEKPPALLSPCLACTLDEQSIISYNYKFDDLPTSSAPSP
jgi:hypothetical protein